MNVFINNEQCEMQTSGLLADILTQINLTDKRGIAVAVNNSIVAKSSWTSFKLKENDKITIITATQGG